MQIRSSVWIASRGGGGGGGGGTVKKKQLVLSALLADNDIN